MRPRERKRFAKALLRLQAAIPEELDPIEATRYLAAYKRREKGYLAIRDSDPHYLRHLGLEDVLVGER